MACVHYLRVVGKTTWDEGPHPQMAFACEGLCLRLFCPPLSLALTSCLSVLAGVGLVAMVTASKCRWTGLDASKMGFRTKVEDAGLRSLMVSFVTRPFS